ncbi:hypothetical protein BBN63_14715 [Streptomyces niveus]|uniref:Uncharacterized protein n=1 Tax=Streptomyces niveus TaxID=193462 RepID=A0A1U9QSZ2_STRNV|nr:hypothetical protein BBN63_14715 [Streptomyces niveus]
MARLPRVRPRDDRWAEIGEEAFQEDERRITGRHHLPEPLPDWAEDLFRVARAAFIAHKYVRRTGVQDRWTRRISLAVPVTEYERWQSEPPVPTSPHFSGSSRGLWSVDFRPLAGHQVEEAMVFPGYAQPEQLWFGTVGIRATDLHSRASTASRAVQVSRCTLHKLRSASYIQ